MRILFAISILAFLALLWASGATMQHIRRTRRRRRRVLESTEQRNTPVSAPEINFTDPSKAEIKTTSVPTPTPDALPLDTDAATSEPEAAIPVHEATTASPSPEEWETPMENGTIYEPEITFAAEEQLEAEALSRSPESEAERLHQAPEPETAFARAEPLPTEPIQVSESQPFDESASATPEPEPEITFAAEEQLEAEASSLEHSAASSVEPEMQPQAATQTADPPPPPPPPRPFPAVPPKHPLASLIPPIHRPDWAYFNKDMGDLSDPEPRSPRLRLNNRD